MTERFKVIQAVFVAIIQDGKVLLQLRQNTGYMNGYYDLPSGHVEKDESLLSAAVREVKEEVDIDIQEDHLRLFHICQSMATPDKPFVYYFFEAKQWGGISKIGDTKKVADVAYFNMKKLPKTVTYVITALKDINSKDVGFQLKRRAIQFMTTTAAIQLGTTTNTPPQKEVVPLKP